MRRFLLVIFVVSCGLTAIEAQAWEVLNTSLKAEKRGRDILLSFMDESKSVIIRSDTLFWDEASGYIFFRNKQLTGIIDPWELEIVQEPAYISIETIGTDYYLVQGEDGFFLAIREFPLEPVSDKYEVVDKLLARGDGSWLETDPLLISRKGKYGLLLLGNGGVEMALKPEVDEINGEKIGEKDYVYFFRKGDKWGAGRCEGVEIEAKYDQIAMLGGNCGETAYIVWKNDKCGIAKAQEEDPVIPVVYENITYLEKNNLHYLFLFENDIPVKMAVSDNAAEWYEFYIPEFLIRDQLRGKSFLVYRDNGDLVSLALTEEDIRETGILTMDIIHLD